MVFDMDQAPKGREEFMAWYDQQTEWAEDHSYGDPKVSAPALREWFLEMIATYPAMNGEYAPKGIPDDDSSIVDYSTGKSVIYAAFPWTVAEQAYQDVFRLAAKHGVGFFDASSELGEVWLPDGRGGLKLAHSE